MPSLQPVDLVLTERHGSVARIRHREMARALPVARPPEPGAVSVADGARALQERRTGVRDGRRRCAPVGAKFPAGDHAEMPQWEYDALDLNELPKRTSVVDVLNDA